MKNITFITALKKKQEFEVGENEEKIFFIFLSDNENMVGDVSIKVIGKNAKAWILGIVLGSGNQEIRLHTYQDHQEREGISDLLIKTALFGQAKFFYEGLIKIEKNAQRSNAFQKNQNLLLSDRAWAESKPYLEILANDVRCTHGATIGQLDGEQLYYLGTRGLSEKEAKKMLITGFFQDVVSKIHDKGVEKELMEKITHKVETLLYT